MSRDYDGNKAFYQAVFGYSFGDIGAEGMRYSTLDLGGRPVGGIGEISADQPADTSAHWWNYFAVAGHGRVTGQGDRARRCRRGAPAWDSPYGRMAVVSDNQGAVFSVMSVAPESES